MLPIVASASNPFSHPATHPFILPFFHLLFTQSIHISLFLSFLSIFHWSIHILIHHILFLLSPCLFLFLTSFSSLSQYSSNLFSCEINICTYAIMNMQILLPAELYILFLVRLSFFQELLSPFPFFFFG